MYIRRFCKILLFSSMLGVSLSHAADMNGSRVTKDVKSELVSQSITNKSQKADLTNLSLGELNASEKATLKSGLGSIDKSKPLQVGLERTLSKAQKMVISPRILKWSKATGKESKSAVLSITSDGAESVRAAISLKNIDIDGVADKVKISFFGAENNTVYGPYLLNKLVGEVSEYDKENMIYWSPVIDGSMVGVEIEVPDGVDLKDVPVTLEKVSHIAISLIRKELSAIGNSGSCNIDVQCDPGEYSEYASSTAKYLFTQGLYTYLCTGTVLNDSDASTDIPYFYTANHCVGGSDSAAATINSFWNFEKEYCGASDPTSVQQLSNGAELLAFSDDNDYAFLRLNDSLFSGTWMSGWSSDDLPGQPIVGIHHPAGDLKKISYGYVDALTSLFDINEDPNGNYIKVTWGEGTTEGGSSGSGLFNTNSNLIGSLTGGAASCSNQSDPDWYGRFSDSYSVVSQWLEATTTEGDAYEPDNSLAQAQLIGGDETQIHSLHVEGDEDWVSFQISGLLSIGLETSGTTTSGGYSDTVIELYDSNGNYLEGNDDGGTGLYSHLVTTLSGGTYYARVRAFGHGSQTINSYSLTFSTDVSDLQPVNLAGTYVQIEPGQAGQLSLEMNNNQSVVGLQFDIEFNSSLFTINGVTGTDNAGSALVSGSLVEPGVYRVIVSNLDLQPLNNGALINLDIAATSDVELGFYYLPITNVLMSDAAGSLVEIGFINDFSVNIALYSDIDIQMGSVTGAPGDIVSLPLEITNNDVVVGTLFDYLYDDSRFAFVGVSSSHGHLLVDGSDHGDGSFTVLAVDLALDELPDGELLTLELEILPTTEDGQHYIDMIYGELTDDQSRFRQPNSVNGTGIVTVVSTIPGDANGDGTVNIQDVIAIINAALNGESATPGSDTNGDGVVNIQDVIAAINLALGVG